MATTVARFVTPALVARPASRSVPRAAAAPAKIGVGLTARGRTGPRARASPVVRASFKIAKDCISMIFGYEDYEHLLTVMFNSEIAALCSDAPMFYFATYPSDTSKDLVYADGVPHLYITPNALNNHKKFAADYFSSTDFTMPEKARKCMADAAANPNV